MIVSREQREAFTDYMYNFFNIPDNYLNADNLANDITIIEGYKKLIESGIKTPQDITKDLLREYSVLIPYNFILELKKWYKIV